MELVTVLGYDDPDNPKGYESDTFINVIGSLLLEIEMVVSCFCPGAIPPPWFTLYVDPSEQV